MKYRRLGMKAAVLAAALFLFSTAAQANVKQVKAYKEIFPDEKPKCLACHAMEKPKKEGPHDLNDYGHKVKALADAAKKEAPDADTYKEAGKIPE